MSPLPHPISCPPTTSTATAAGDVPPSASPSPGPAACPPAASAAPRVPINVSFTLPSCLLADNGILGCCCYPRCHCIASLLPAPPLPPPRTIASCPPPAKVARNQKKMQPR
ncbi:Os04g0507050 [Oryza sativa Japonica Group]|uniref:Os04g0507050 protein n=1 Tax=Oryza sativa subsp. japonica TaxID=39947 RepID=A0A0P0WC29_ORYSJ|nr:Os04g0507050 [Oryza sativa Japonica Group]